MTVGRGWAPMEDQFHYTEVRMNLKRLEGETMRNIHIWRESIWSWARHRHQPILGVAGGAIRPLDVVEISLPCGYQIRPTDAMGGPETYRQGTPSIRGTPRGCG